MSKLQELLDYNKDFVKNRKYEKYRTTKYPDKKMAIVTCMDTRLIELLPKALGIKNGDAKFIKNAGGVVVHPFGSIMRSILVAIYELGSEEVFVIGHHGCGMSNLDSLGLVQKMKERGVSEDTMSTLRYSGIDVEKWLHGFDCVRDSVKESVSAIRNHPLTPKDVPVHGLIMDPETGEVEVAVDGYERR